MRQLLDYLGASAPEAHYPNYNCLEYIIQIRPKKGLPIIFCTHIKNPPEVFKDNGDIIIHAAKDLVLLSDNYILENPSGKTNVTSLPEYKSKN